MAYEPVNSSQYTCADSDACLLFWEVFTPFFVLPGIVLCHCNKQALFVGYTATDACCLY